MKYCLAIDIGASSGRHIVGFMENGLVKTDEVFRFPNGAKEEKGHLVWDTEEILSFVKEGIDRALDKYEIDSLSIDTWGVDYVLMKGNEEVLPVYAYRDSGTLDVIEKVHGIIPFSELYSRTGCQFQPFNSIYQLYRDKELGRLEGVTDWLMMPEYLMYKLCGTKAKEYTNATTSGLINGEAGSFDTYITDKLGLARELFPQLLKPGMVIGKYKGIKVVLCATHDTGSAVEGIPMEGSEPYISSGTWSLLGVKTQKAITTEESMGGNWSNEGGPYYNRYQKNIMGMWLVNELRSELMPDTPFDEITKKASESTFAAEIDANDPSLMAPKSMKAAFDNLLGFSPEKPEDYFSCAYRSLASCYRNAMEELERNTGKKYSKLYIVGGGAKNDFLNRLTAEKSGKEIIALPIEATALGNLKIQLEENNEQI